MFRHRCFAFSNGTQNDINSLLTNAGLSQFFQDIVVVDDMPIPFFKPHPEIYKYLINQTDSVESNTWLISSNPFDIIGAANCGWNTAWMRRSEDVVFGPWPNVNAPTVTVRSFSDLKDAIENHAQ